MPHRQAKSNDEVPPGMTMSPAALDAQNERQLAQLSALATLSRQALDAGIDELTRHAVDALCEGLSADAARVLELVDDQVQFRLRVGAGIQHLPDRGVEVHADRRTPAGRALRQHDVVIVDDIDEADMQRLPLLDAPDFTSAIEVCIPGLKPPFGVLGAHSRRSFAFDASDTHFIQTVAHIIGEGIKRERTNRQRRRMYEELHRALAAREEALSVISHDLRSPASVMRLSLEVVRRAVGGNGESISIEQVERAINKANSNLDRMLHMMDDMLAINRSETDVFELEWEQVDLHAVVVDVVADFAQPLADAGASVSITGDESVVGCWNWMRLQQIVSNLLSNAIKYGQGSPITIAVSQQNGSAKLQVKDRGRGIAEGDQQRIFERFQRLDHRDNEDLPDSYGLGLWIVKRVVDVFGGTISVDSKPGEETTFSVELPRQPRREPPEEGDADERTQSP